MFSLFVTQFCNFIVSFQSDGKISGISSPTSGFSRLPPIVTSENDRQFLKGLNEYIEFELEKVNSNDDEQRYIIYKTAFNRVSPPCISDNALMKTFIISPYPNDS